MANADREMVDGLRVRTDVNAPGFGNPAGGPANAARRATPRCRKPVPSKPVMKAMQQLWRANGGEGPPPEYASLETRSSVAYTTVAWAGGGKPSPAEGTATGRPRLAREASRVRERDASAG